MAELVESTMLRPGASAGSGVGELGRTRGAHEEPTHARRASELGDASSSRRRPKSALVVERAPQQRVAQRLGRDDLVARRQGAQRREIDPAPKTLNNTLSVPNSVLAGRGRPAGSREHGSRVD